MSDHASQPLAKIETVKKTQAQIDAEREEDANAQQTAQTAENNEQAGVFTRLKASWKNRGTLGDDKLQHHHVAFMPAALEIQQTPPNLLAKRVGQLIILFFVICVIWACFGKVNVVAVAEGKIIPSSRIKHIQPLDKGVVSEIFVKEGQSVKAGEKLIALDRTLTSSDITRISNNLVVSQLAQARLEQFLALLKGETESTNFSIEDNIGSDVERLNENQLLHQQWQQYKAQLGAYESSRQAKQAELETTEAQVIKLEQMLPIYNKRAQSYKNLAKEELISEEEYLDIEQKRIETQQDLISQRASVRRLMASIDEVVQQIDALAAETMAQSLQQLSETANQVKSLQEELNKATDVNAKQVLYAPVDGVVQELKVNTIGGVVTEAQDLMTIVPDDEVLEVQAFLQNKDIGFVQAGMPAEIKVHTFPFTKYGIIEAEVKNITDDALADQENGLIFAMQLEMAKNTINVNGKNIRLRPGMQVTAEVKTGKRRVIEYVMTPVLKGFKESVRER